MESSNHGVDGVIFGITVLGGVAGSAVTVAVLTVIKSPLAAVVVGVGVVVLDIALLYI
jgi:hypothetical protein